MSSDLSAEAMPAASKGRHPAGLYVLFATELWERFGFYTIAAIITLYLQDKVQGFGWSRDKATTLWSDYMMFVYASPLVGGLIADWKLGYRLSVILGGVLFTAGYGLLTVGTYGLFYPALLLLVLGNGFFKPNISTMVGNLYPSGSPLRDRAYNIFYMGINIGAFTAPIVAEVLRQKFGFRWAFGAAACGMAFGTVLFCILNRMVAAADLRKPTGNTPEIAGERPRSAIDDVPERTRILALLVVFFIVIVFWMSFHQNGTTMTYWANDNTDWAASKVTPTIIKVLTLGLIDGSNVSGVISNAINPFWVVALSFPLVSFWGWMNKKGLEPSTPTKIALGMILTGLAFLILYFAAKSGGDQTFATDSAGNFLRDAKGDYQMTENKVSPWWLIGAYAVLSLGELLLSPMGLSLVSKVAPERMRGMMMGGWFVATAIGNKLTMIGLLWTKWHHSSFWLLVSGLAFGMAMILLTLLRPLKKAMPGV